MDLWKEGNTWSFNELIEFPILTVIKTFQYIERAAMDFAEQREKVTYTEDKRNDIDNNKVRIYSQFSLVL